MTQIVNFFLPWLAISVATSYGYKTLTRKNMNTAQNCTSYRENQKKGV
jgi:hypothetical protein